MEIVDQTTNEVSEKLLRYPVFNGQLGFNKTQEKQLFINQSK